MMAKTPKKMGDLPQLRAPKAMPMSDDHKAARAVFRQDFPKVKGGLPRSPAEKSLMKKVSGC